VIDTELTGTVAKIPGEQNSAGEPNSATHVPGFDGDGRRNSWKRKDIFLDPMVAANHGFPWHKAGGAPIGARSSDSLVGGVLVMLAFAWLAGIHVAWSAGNVINFPDRYSREGRDSV